MDDEIELLKLSLAKLPNEEARTLAIVDYLELRRATGSLDKMPEGSVASLINLLPPHLRSMLTENALCLPRSSQIQIEPLPDFAWWLSHQNQKENPNDHA